MLLLRMMLTASTQKPSNIPYCHADPPDMLILKDRDDAWV